MCHVKLVCENSNDWKMKIYSKFEYYYHTLGEEVRSEFMMLNFTIGQFNWHLFSYEIQKILPIIIMNAQQPVLIEWFGSISCVREVFKKVCHSKIRGRIRSIRYIQCIKTFVCHFR